MSDKDNMPDAANEDALSEFSDEEQVLSTGEEPDHTELTALLEDARGKADEHWDQVVRLQAEMDNLRKRSERDLANAHKFALERFANELLPVNCYRSGIAWKWGWRRLIPRRLTPKNSGKGWY